MPRLDPAVRLGEMLASLPRDGVPGLADHVIERSKSLSIQRGREEVALDKAGGKNVYVVAWHHRGDLLDLCFFGDSEHDVVDLLSVAEVMLG